MASYSMPIRVLDGGLGSTLEAAPYGVTFSAATPLWSSHLLLHRQSTLEHLHAAYVAAGADVLLTATYQASFEGFAATRPLDIEKDDPGCETRHAGSDATGLITGYEESDANTSTRHHASDAATFTGHGESTATTPATADQAGGYNEVAATKYMRSAVGLARRAFTDQHSTGLVALSLGAYGATTHPSTEYSGAYPPAMLSAAQLEAWHSRRLAVFNPHWQASSAEAASSDSPWPDIDLVAFETIPLVQEVVAIRQTMHRMNSHQRKAWWVSAVFPGPNEGEKPAAVETFVQAMLGSMLDGQRPWGIGINCTTISRLPSLVLEFEAALKKLQAGGEYASEWSNDWTCYKHEERNNSDSNLQQWPWLVLYPDGAQGLTYNTATQVWEGTYGAEGKSWDEQMIDLVGQIRQSCLWRGLLLGGCCKTTPLDIKRLRARIDAL